MNLQDRAESIAPPPVLRPALRTPGDIQPDADGKLPWWRPGWSDVALHIGWRWLWLGPLLLLGLLSAVALLFPPFWGITWFWGYKFWLFLAGIAATIAAQAIKSAMTKREGPFCIHCGYSLSGLPDHYLCPECGRPYSLALIEEYKKDPHWFVERWKTQRGGFPASVPIAARPSTRRRSRDGT